MIMGNMGRVRGISRVRRRMSAWLRDLAGLSGWISSGAICPGLSGAGWWQEGLARVRTAYDVRTYFAGAHPSPVAWNKRLQRGKLSTIPVDGRLGVGASEMIR